MIKLIFEVTLSIVVLTATLRALLTGLLTMLKTPTRPWPTSLSPLQQHFWGTLILCVARPYGLHKGLQKCSLKSILLTYFLWWWECGPIWNRLYFNRLKRAEDKARSSSSWLMQSVHQVFVTKCGGFTFSRIIALYNCLVMLSPRKIESPSHWY